LMILDNEGRSSMSLRERLADWTDVDVAQYHLGLLLGALPPMEDGETEGDHFRRCKGIFWSANGLGDALYETLVGMAAAGLLERQPDEHGIHGPCPFRFVEEPPTEESPGK